MNNTILIKLTDGGLVDYKDDVYYNSGCPTCDYGSEYINYITLYLTKYKVEVTLNKMYGYLVSQGDVIKWFMSEYDHFKTMSEIDFIEWFKIKIAKKVYDCYYPVYSNVKEKNSDKLTYEELLEFIEHEDDAVNDSCKATDKILREFSVTEIKGN